MSRKTRILAIVIVVIMLFALSLGLIMSVAAPATAAPGPAELDVLRENAAALAAQRDKLQTDLDATRQQHASAIEQKTALDNQIQNTDAEIEAVTSLIDALDAQIADNEAELAQALLDEADQDALFRARVRAMEEAGDAQYLDVLLGGDSYSDLLGRMGTMQEIMEYDQSILALMKETQDRIKTARTALDADLAEQQTAMSNLDDLRGALSGQLADQIKMIEDLENEETTDLTAMDEADAAQDQIQAEIDAALAEIARQAAAASNSDGSNVVNVPANFVGGQFNWPLPGYSRISSYFGNRTHPVYGNTRMHTGIDIPASKGTPIHASNSGVVATASYNGGYGNCVTITHGGGLLTLYGHMSKIAVSSGEAVEAGDVIGYVGSTGVSTGNHLHFEVRLNGNRVDPLDYVSP